MDEKKNEIILFENQGVKLEVNLKDETVWLNSEQMAQLFGRDYKTIRKHINNINYIYTFLVFNFPIVYISFNFL